MIIFPAIDLQNARVVRLEQGDFNLVSIYSKEPVNVAKRWQNLGAQWLHVVDLDGAKTGSIKNIESIINIAQAIKRPVQVGGGIRTEEEVDMLLDQGVQRVVLSTRALEDRPFLKDLIAKRGDRIAVSIDCKGGYVAQRGWIETSDIKATDLIIELQELGVKCIIYTDISRDGMLTGPNFEELEEILEISDIPIIASGGVATIEDIKKLKELEEKGLMGAIIGKALYEEKLDFKKILEIC